VKGLCHPKSPARSLLRMLRFWILRKAARPDFRHKTAARQADPFPPRRAISPFQIQRKLITNFGSGHYATVIRAPPSSSNKKLTYHMEKCWARGSPPMMLGPPDREYDNRHVDPRSEHLTEWAMFTSKHLSLSLLVP